MPSKGNSAQSPPPRSSSHATSSPTPTRKSVTPARAELPVHDLSFGHRDSDTEATPFTCENPILALYGEIAQHTHDPNALCTIGWMYYFGLGGCASNAIKAYAYFFAAAQSRDHGIAHYYLGQLQQRGLGTKKNGAAALRSFTVAAEAGLHQAMFALGKLLERGCGSVEPNPDLAIQWYSKAAALGNTMAEKRADALRGNPGGV